MLSRIDQIEAHPGKCPQREFDRCHRLGGAMPTPERPQGLVAQGLHPDRQPVDAGGGESGKGCGVARSRIGLERDFRCAVGPPEAQGRLDYCTDGRWRHR